MTDSRLSIKRGAILYNKQLASAIQPEYFEPDYWQQHGTVSSAIGGRGTVVFINSGSSLWALRHCHRGGLVSRVFKDHYVWFGEQYVRSFREFRMLNILHADGLPVPRPVAARYQRDGLAYTADLITERIDGALPLSQRLVYDPLPPSTWRIIGAGLRRFHDAGACHSDLNAHNILLDNAACMYLVDFDRGRIRPPGRWREANLKRLQRSLNKISGTMPGVSVHADDWMALLEGYSPP